jgi:hypothetical protein
MSLSILAQTTTQGDEGIWVFLVFWGLIFAAIGASMARRRFRPVWLGLVLGFFLSWIGLIVLAVMGPKSGPPCIACGMPLQLSWVGGQTIPARVCLMCGADQRQTAWQPQPQMAPPQYPATPQPGPPPVPPAPVG